MFQKLNLQEKRDLLRQDIDALLAGRFRDSETDTTRDSQNCEPSLAETTLPKDTIIEQLEKRIQSLHKQLALTLQRSIRCSSFVKLNELKLEKLARP
jgi:hypothetical protein